MNKKWMVVMACIGVLMLGACGQEGSAATDEQAGNAYTDTAGQGEGTLENSDGISEDSAGGYVADDPMSQIQGFTFPAEICGVYAGFYSTYEPRHFVVEEDQVVFIDHGLEIVFDSEDFSLQGIENEDDAFIYYYYSYFDADHYETSLSGNLNIRFDKETEALYGSLDLYSPSGESISYQGSKSDVLFGIPGENYVSLDDLGEFGALPMTDAVKAIILENVSEDYFITVQKGYEVYAGDQPYACDIFVYTSFDEDGYVIPVSGTIYVCPDSESARLICEASNAYSQDWTQSDNIVYSTYTMSQETRHDHYGSKQYYLSTYEAYMVYGEHCFKNRDYETYYYFSKPYSLEDGQRFVDASALLAEIGTYSSTSVDGNYTVNLSGSGFSPYINISDTMGALTVGDLGNVKADGDTLYAYGNTFGLDAEDNYRGYSVVIIASAQDDNLTLRVMKYEEVDVVNYDNYEEFTAIVDETITVPIIRY